MNSEQVFQQSRDQAMCKAISIAILLFAIAVQGQDYFRSVIGYFDVTFVAGSNLIANPLNASDNTVSNVLRGVPDGTVLLPFPRLFIVATR